jgi:hypothetical protein
MRTKLCLALFLAIPILAQKLPDPAPRGIFAVQDTIDGSPVCTSSQLQTAAPAASWNLSVAFVWGNSGNPILCESNGTAWQSFSGSGGGYGAGFGLSVVSGNLAVSTSVISSVAASQSGVQTACISTTGTTNYVCSFVGSGSAALTAYTTGMTFTLFVDTASTSTATINIDGLGSKTLDQADCSSAISTQISANQFYRVGYNGTVMCLVH